ncbi:RNA-binding domain-containing protein [Daldinia loculata]|uniref:RNA-binding domain-containing protein n=1 Tax=Daldinia loculata TaxID=103429 RepID=UPI0020C267E9|nr:RNA-binding domain-containing protein [Daldinia loculata]KAI1645811.1 RNA-binding domain-containing protein [Daldinia loculata]KAI2782218.1 RNA-binding domain-containing protein [Daldinia loculata]
MDYRSPSRDRFESRSPTPKSRYSRSPSPVRRRRSPTKSPSPAPRRNGRLRSESRSSSRDRDDRGRSESPLRGSTKIVVEKLTKTINEDHLHEIFGQYGPIRDLDMPMNRQYNTNRGTAYILYVHEADAEAAIAHMHEAVLDGAVINVSIVLPRRKFSPSPPTASRGANIDPRLPAPGPRGSARTGGGRGAGFGGGRPPRSPQRFGRPGRDNFDTYRPRSYSRSRSPPTRRNRSPSGSYASRSRSPPRRRGGKRESYNDYDNDRRRSPSYDSIRGRSRSRSRGRGYR